MLNLPSKYQYRHKNKKRGEIWLLFQATDFQSLMYPNFTLSKILGIFPYRIKISSFETSKPRYILWTVILCAVCVYWLTLLYKLNLSERIKMDVTKIVSLNFTYIYGLFITIVSYTSSGPRMRLLQTISDISSKLPQQSYRKLSKLIHAKDIIGFFFILMRLILIKNTHMIFDYLVEICRVYTTLWAFQMDMLYINCVCVLKACFKEINDKLENLRKFIMINISSQHHEQRYPFLLMELKALQKQHLMISDTVQMLNIIFSLYLLAIIILSFKQIIFHVYFHIVQWQDGISFTLDTIYNMFFTTFILFYLIRIMLIVWACETGKNQAIEIGTTIHDVLNTTSDKHIKYELQLFSLQILHCDNTFSTKGLAINTTLLVTMVNIITMYLLILIQFLGASHSCDEKTTINVAEAISLKGSIESKTEMQL